MRCTIIDQFDRWLSKVPQGSFNDSMKISGVSNTLRRNKIGILLAVLRVPLAAAGGHALSNGGERHDVRV
jgi:hypothetical protein